MDKRRKQHENAARYRPESSAFHRALGKYGNDAFVWYEVEACTSTDELNDRERYNIEYFRTLTPHGYNLLAGGQDYKKHPDTCRRISERTRGRVGSRTGQKNTAEHTEAIKKNMSTSRKFILQNLTTGEMRRFESIHEAVNATGSSLSAMSKLINRKPGFRSTRGWALQEVIK